MKFNIPIKLLITFIVFFCIFVVVFFAFTKSIENEIVINAGEIITQGVLINLENQLINMPKANWDAIIKKLADNTINIKSIDDLNFTTKQKNELNNGEIIFKSGATYQFLNEVIVEHTAYKKIGKSSYVLAYFFSSPADYINHYINLPIKLIVTDLLSKSASTWNEEVPKLEKLYGFPLHVYKAENNNLPSAIVNSLSINKLVFETSKHTSRIDTIYYAFDGGILKIGPLSYLSISGRISDVMNYFILSFFILSLLLIIFLSLLFVRNMKKIYQVTENFSHGNFDTHIKIGATSVLHSLHVNINIMGQKLQQLIESHKQMCRFVAHETRTPLSTMQMAIDRIKNVDALDSTLLEKINSIQEDIDDLNSLVSTFLIYSQLQSKYINLNKTKLDINSRLEELVARYQVSKINISLDVNKAEINEIYVDEKLFKHAINNLIINATKFAKNKVIISVEKVKDKLAIHVDDDGPGLSEDLAEVIFSEYSCTEDTERYDKHIGLGLAIVKKVILVHEGNVFATSSPTLKGARFTILLPGGHGM